MMFNILYQQNDKYNSMNRFKFNLSFNNISWNSKKELKETFKDINCIHFQFKELIK